MKRRLPAALAAALLLAACKDSTGPGGVDTGALSDDVAAITTLFENNAAYQSMSSLATYFPSFGAASLVRSTLPLAPRRLMDLRPSAWRVAVPAAVGGPGGAQALFPANVLGKTFEWNVTTDVYEATARTGAPATGIRIIIYSVNPVNGAPTEPLQELGYLELTDESTPAADRIGVLLKLGTTTIADYDITAATGTTSEQFTAVGYLVGATGSGRVDFDVMIFNDFNTGGGDFEYHLTAQDGGAVVVDIHDNGNQTATLLIRVSRGDNSVEITSTETANGSTGQVKLNGTVVANMTQTGDADPVFTGANGRQLTEQQKADIGGMIFGVFILVFGSLIGIMAPTIVVF